MQSINQNNIIPDALTVKRLERLSRSSKYLGLVFLPIVFIMLGYTTFSLKDMYVEQATLTKQNEEIKNQIIKQQSDKERLLEETKSLEDLKGELERELTLKFGVDLNGLSQSEAQAAIDLSMNANTVIQDFRDNLELNSNLVVKYYSKEVEQERIVVELRAAGIKYMDREPSAMMSKRQTNAIWFGSDVTIDEVKFVALVLIRAGANIQAIRPYRASLQNPDYKSNIIEIGASIDVQNEPPYTIEKVLSAESFSR